MHISCFFFEATDSEQKSVHQSVLSNFDWARTCSIENNHKRRKNNESFHEWSAILNAWSWKTERMSKQTNNFNWNIPFFFYLLKISDMSFWEYSENCLWQRLKWAITEIHQCMRAYLCHFEKSKTSMNHTK